MKKLIFLLSLLVSAPAFAQVSGLITTDAGTRYCRLGKAQRNGRVLNDVSLNAAAASRTFTIGQESCNEWTASYQWLIVELDFTYDTKAGNVVLTCTTGQAIANADKTPQVCVGAGTCTALDAGIVSKAVTANKKWAARIGIRGYVAWSCVVAHDGTPGAGERITARAYLID